MNEVEQVLQLLLQLYTRNKIHGTKLHILDLDCLLMLFSSIASNETSNTDMHIVMDVCYETHMSPPTRY